MLHGLQMAYQAIERAGKPDSADKPDSCNDLRDGIRYGYGDAGDGIRLEITNTMGPKIISFLEVLKAEYAVKGTVLSVTELSCQQCYLEPGVLAQIIAFCGPKLEFLDVSNNYFVDLQIEPIKEVKSLKKLCLDYNPDLSDAAIQALEKSLSLAHTLVVVRKDPAQSTFEADPLLSEWVPSQSLQSAQVQDSVPPVSVPPTQQHRRHQRTFSTATTLTTVVSLNHETDDLSQGPVYNDEPWSQQSNATLVFAFPNSQQAASADNESTQVHSSSHSAARHHPK